MSLINVSKKQFVLSWDVKENERGLSLFDYLRVKKQISSRLLKKLKQEKNLIRVNNKHQTVRYQIQAGDKVSLYFPEEEKGVFMIPEAIDFQIVYEDPHILIVNKPAGILTIPSGLNRSGTLANGILHYYKQNNYPYTVHVVTRLDRDTSGLVLIAKHAYSHSLLSKDQNKKINRRYYALVNGLMPQKNGMIDAPIGRSESSIIERQVTPKGKRAITYYQRKKLVNDLSLLNIQLETGRTHQIRVHFAHINYPLLGDGLYGCPNGNEIRTQLHCYELEFVHPMTEELLRFKEPLPDDFKQHLIDKQ